MKFIKKNKAAIVFYLVLVSCALILSYSNKQYDNKKSISAGIGIADIQK